MWLHKKRYGPRAACSPRASLILPKRMGEVAFSNFVTNLISMNIYRGYGTINLMAGPLSFLTITT